MELSWNVEVDSESTGMTVKGLGKEIEWDEPAVTAYKLFAFLDEWINYLLYRIMGFPLKRNEICLCELECFNIKEITWQVLHSLEHITEG